MAKTSMVAKQRKKQKYVAREYTRCERCGRSHSVYRRSKSCCICFRELTYRGQISGIRKVSW